MNILPIIEKIQKWTPKNQKFENPSTTHKFYVDLGPKRYLGPRYPIIGSMGCGVPSTYIHIVSLNLKKSCQLIKNGVRPKKYIKKKKSSHRRRFIFTCMPIIYKYMYVLYFWNAYKKLYVQYLNIFYVSEILHYRPSCFKNIYIYYLYV